MHKKLSAGVPLTYYHAHGNSSTSVENLTTKFLEIPFTADQGCTYRKTGFLPYIALTEIFNTKYTKVSGEKLQVRAMKAEDIYVVTGLTEMQTGTTMNLSAVKYNKLLVNGADYYLASAYDSNYLWAVHNNGYVNYYAAPIFGARPVVSLSSEVKVSVKDMIGAWKIEI